MIHALTLPLLLIQRLCMET